jgi:hypothetical protein
MRIVVKNRVKLSSAESMALALPHFDKIESGTKQRCTTFEAGVGFLAHHKVKVGQPDVSVSSIGYQGTKRTSTRGLADDNGEKGKHDDGIQLDLSTTSDKRSCAFSSVGP